MSTTSATDRKARSVRRPAKAMSAFTLALVAACAVFVALGLVLTSSASAEPSSKAVFGKFCAPGTETENQGGKCRLNKGLAVNDTGAGGVGVGDVYYADGNNHRIQRFDKVGAFKSAWGIDVVASGKPGDLGTTAFEVCTVAADCKAGAASGAAGGLTQPWGAAIDQDTGVVYVTDRNNRRISVFSATGEFQGAFGWQVIQGSVAEEFQFCTSITGCKAGPTGKADPGALASTDASPTVAPSTGTIYVPDPGNARLNEFDVAVNGEDEVIGASFVRALGWDVIPIGGPGDTGVELEACTDASGCQKGTTGAGAGQFSSAQSPGSVAVDANGFIYAANLKTTGSCEESSPCGILKFNPSGTFKEDWGPQSGQCQLSFTSGAATSVEAFEVAVNPSSVDGENRVVVARKTGDSGSMRVLEFDENGSAASCVQSPAAAKSALATNAALNNRGLAMASDGRVYVHTSANPGGEIYILGTVPPPEVKMLEVADVGDESAEFVGEVTVPEPGGEGFDTGYHFEYSSDGVNWTSVPNNDLSAGFVAGTQEVSLVVSGLTPNTVYQARLVGTTATRAISNSLSFKTSKAAPKIAQTFVEEVTQTSARLGAHIGPQNLQTSYHFEWGPTDGYGNRVPAFDRSIGSGSGEVIVGEPITGLAHETVYHYRVVATNSEGTTVGPDQTFETLNSCALTDGRCYELVSPPDKGVTGAGGDRAILGQDLAFQVAPFEPRIAYQIAYGLPDATSGGEVLYEGERAPSGWSASQLSVPTLAVPSSEATSLAGRTRAMSPDLNCSIQVSTQELADDAPDSMIAEGNALLYHRTRAGAFKAVTTIAPTNPNALPITLEEYRVEGIGSGATGECDRVVFATEYQYPGLAGDGAQRLYEWDDGTLRGVGVVPGPSGPEGAEAVAGASTQENNRHAVSSDAGRIFFSATSKLGGDINQQAVFLRERQAIGAGDLSAGSTTVANVEIASGEFQVGQELEGPGIPLYTTIIAVDGAEDELSLSQPAEDDQLGADLVAKATVDVSQSQTATPNDGSSRYETAARDGDAVFFTARYGLAANGNSAGPASCDTSVTSGGLNGPGCDLYMYSTEDETLTALSVAGPGAGNPNGAGVTGVIAASDDGSHVYFAARGQLVAGKGNTEAANLAADAFSVYLWDGGALSYVGPMLREQSNYLAVSNKVSTGSQTRPQASPDGRFLVWETAADVTGYDSEGFREAYRYSAEDEQVICLSCRRDGRLSQSTPDFRVLSNGEEVANRLSPPRSISADGERVFFTSLNRLATGATEGRPNLYQWKGGQVSFLASSEPSVAAELRFAGSSANGDDVYFATVDRLTWEDTDGKLDVYGARVGGGFAPPPPPPAACDPLSESSCLGAPTAPAAPPPAPGSSTLLGEGNPSADRSVRCRARQVRRGRRCVPKRALARRVCRKKRGSAKRRCIRRQVRRLNRVQQRRLRAANANRGGQK